MNERRQDSYKVSTVADLKKRCGLTAYNHERLSLDKHRVPARLRPLIPYAEFWGASDDTIREQLAERVPLEARKELKEIIRQYDDLLDEWLAGPESSSANPSREYIAFSAMRMIADTF